MAGKITGKMVIQGIELLLLALIIVAQLTLIPEILGITLSLLSVWMLGSFIGASAIVVMLWIMSLNEKSIKVLKEKTTIEEINNSRKLYTYLLQASFFFFSVSYGPAILPVIIALRLGFIELGLRIWTKILTKPV